MYRYADGLMDEFELEMRMRAWQTCESAPNDWNDDGAGGLSIFDPETAHVLSL
jgi:hypothetical protein